MNYSQACPKNCLCAFVLCFADLKQVFLMSTCVLLKVQILPGGENGFKASKWGCSISHAYSTTYVYKQSDEKKMGKSRMKHIVEYQNIGRTNQTLEKQLLPTRGRPLLKRLGVGKYKVLFYIFMNAIGIFFLLSHYYQLYQRNLPGIF